MVKFEAPNASNGSQILQPSTQRFSQVDEKIGRKWITLTDTS